MADKDAIARGMDALAEKLAEVCIEALNGAGFYPSERLQEKFHEEIRYALTVK